VTNGTRTTVEGADTLTRTLGEAADDLAAMAPPEVGALLVGKSRAAAPYVSGALRGSVQADLEPGRVKVSSGLIYAPVIHNGWAAHNIKAQPFLIPVAEQMASVWGHEYVAETARVVRSDVRGA
jgi:hypothetical protein